MITQEQYLELEAEIRKSLPRTKKLSKGCKILFDLNDFYTDVVGEIIGIDDANVAIVISEDLDQRAIPLKKISKEKIIGHDILLSDVLEWLKELELSNKINIFNIGCTEMGQFVILYKKKYYFWNLSKPYLKDQSEELIEFLYNLIEE